ncbi:hypothetical protein ACS0TY_008374 [Phlomoides rotata]
MDEGKVQPIVNNSAEKLRVNAISPNKVQDGDGSGRVILSEPIGSTVEVCTYGCIILMLKLWLMTLLYLISFNEKFVYSVLTELDEEIAEVVESTLEETKLPDPPANDDGETALVAWPPPWKWKSISGNYIAEG